ALGHREVAALAHLLGQFLEDGMACRPRRRAYQHTPGEAVEPLARGIDLRAWLAGDIAGELERAEDPVSRAHGQQAQTTGRSERWGLLAGCDGHADPNRAQYHRPRRNVGIACGIAPDSQPRLAQRAPPSRTWRRGALRGSIILAQRSGDENQCTG